MKTKKPRNRAAQDATLINVRALKQQVEDVRSDVAKLDVRLAIIEARSKPPTE